uniref:Fibrinogen C-terminal domain-containing protein n=1 Tax=Magallana gigas TaxID=29159 RepID=A0A8W8NW37_MAGGI|nr:fibrinogen-like protein 1 [Crassostrea gigas]XP_034320662.1 fibrinogen-like protein 1 [Crassostrea gigas]
MSLYFGVFSIIRLILTVHLPPVMARSFSARPDCDDKISSIELLAEHQVPSLCSCSALCHVECGCFGFNPQVSKCRIHWSCDVANMTSSEDGWRYYKIDPRQDCKGVLESGKNSSGFYVIDPFGGRQRLVTVYCDMETDGGGWTAIQRRQGGSVNFNKTWTDYKNGFGVPEGSYWLGNDVIHKLTNRLLNSLYVYFRFNNNSIFLQKYAEFSVGEESTNYQLHLAGPTTGSLGDRMINPGSSNTELNGMLFSTLDRDNDRYSGHCATKYSGGWWFNNCHDAYLNGPWAPENWHDPWFPIIADGINIAEVRLMIRPT